MAQFVNLFSSPVKILRSPGATDGSVIVFKSDSAKLGVNLDTALMDTIEAPEWIPGENVSVFPVKVASHLPPPNPGVFYIVPKEIAACALSLGRNDFLYPDEIETPGNSPQSLPTYRGLYRYIV